MNQLPLKGVIHATNCHTRFRYYRYKKIGGWKTVVDRIAAPGTTHWAWKKTAIRRKKRWEILDNEGCGVRYSAYGDD